MENQKSSPKQPATVSKSKPRPHPLSSVQNPSLVPSTVSKATPPQTKGEAQLSDAARRGLDPESEPIVIGDEFANPANLRKLLPKQRKLIDMWLDDAMIDVWFSGLLERAKNNQELPKIQIFSARFGAFFDTENFDKFKDLCKDVPDFFNLQLVLFPLVIEHHWILLTVSPTTKTIVYYDSRFNPGVKHREKLFRYLTALHKSLTQKELVRREWTSVDQHDIPRQTNSHDCGVFVCQYAERLTRNASFDFSQADMPAIRIQMLEQIVAKKITPLPPSHPRCERPHDDKQELGIQLRTLRRQCAEKDAQLEQVKNTAAAGLEERIEAS